MIYRRYYVTVQATIPTVAVGSPGELADRMTEVLRQRLCDESVDVIAVKKVGEWTCDEEEVTA